MKNLLTFYLRRYLKRDIILLGIFAIGIIILATIFRSQFRSANGLGSIHHKMVECWILWNAIYAFLTAFNGFRRIDSCYETMLLPFSANSKFLFSAIRILIIMPIFSAAIMIVVDHGLCDLLNVPTPTRIRATSIYTTMTYSGFIMHRLPVMPFYLFMFTTLAMSIKTVKRRNLTLFIPLALLFCIGIVLYGPHFNFSEYNYPFVSGNVSESSRCMTTGVKFSSSISEIVSWTHLNARMQRVVVYIYLLLLPPSFLYLTYLRFKELEVDQ